MAGVSTTASVMAFEIQQESEQFLAAHCYDCHGDGSKEGGLALDQLERDVSDPASFAVWERIFDRVVDEEMPPADIDERPTTVELNEFRHVLGATLTNTHAAEKGTVLRRLNRREYQNTLNDLFGVSLDLEGMLPEDARSHEFDNVGEALGISMTHMQRYIQAAGLVFDTAVARTTEAPKPRLIDCYYRPSEVERVIGRTVKRLQDGALVRFSRSGLSSGHLREGSTPASGRYRVRVTGYAWQSNEPVVVQISATSYTAGAEQPVIGFASFPPGDATTVEFEASLDARYMLRINPYDIFDPNHYKRNDIDNYKGPGFALLSATMEGPMIDEFPLRGHRLIFDGIKRVEVEPQNPNDKKKRWYKPRFKIQSNYESADAEQSLKRIATAAFRRPVTGDDVVPYLELFATERKKGETFEAALRTVVISVLCSPRFLYLDEPPGRLDDFALGSRLSYFLTRTLPDRDLLQLAAAGQLTASAEVLSQQVDRLMRHPHFDRFIADFADAWLNLREIDFTVPDGKIYPEYDQFLHDSILKETRAFLKELIHSNHPVSAVVKSDFAMLNSRLADHYGVPGVQGVALRKVKLPSDSVRGGLLSQASILKVTANGTNTSPVVRGVWVMERIMGVTPPPPPPGVPGVEPDIRGASTLRELLDKHRAFPNCQSCHEKIDPPGFALEQFNPIGGLRSRFRSIGNGDQVNSTIRGLAVRYRLGPDVDASGEFPDGRQFDDFREFRDHLARDEREIAGALTRKLLTFATGREMGFSDRPEIDRIVAASATRQYRIRDLVHQVIASRIFQQR